MATVLLECGNALVALDRIEALEEAGHRVVRCDGPSHHACPVLDGQPCGLIEEADVVVTALGDDTLRVAVATQVVHPGMPQVALLLEPDAEELVAAVDGIVALPESASDRGIVAATETALARRAEEGTP